MSQIPNLNVLAMIALILKYLFSGSGQCEKEIEKYIP